METSALNTLNKVKNIIINECNNSNINLHDYFKNKEDFNNFVISLTIKTLCDEFNYRPSDAFELVTNITVEDLYKEVTLNIKKQGI